MESSAQYNVVCGGCEQVWAPAVGRPLWWKAKKHAEAGFLNALHVTPQECGCQEEVLHPDAPYRVTGFDDMCVDFDRPFFSLVQAAKLYLELARNGMYTVVFVDRRTEGGRRSRMQIRLEELVWSSRD